MCSTTPSFAHQAIKPKCVAPRKGGGAGDQGSCARGGRGAGGFARLFSRLVLGFPHPTARGGIAKGRLASCSTPEPRVCFVFSVYVVSLFSFLSPLQCRCPCPFPRLLAPLPARPRPSRPLGRRGTRTHKRTRYLSPPHFERPALSRRLLSLGRRARHVEHPPSSLGSNPCAACERRAHALWVLFPV